MDSYPFVSIIVLNFNGKAYLKECFDSLAQLHYPRDKYEVIMGDNASTDDSIEYVRQTFPWVTVVRFAKNYGFCKSNNRCAQRAKGDFLVFLNNDTFVTIDWLSNLVKGALSEPGVISCACKISFPHLDNGRVINAAGGVIFPSGCGMYEGFMDNDSAAYSMQKHTGFGCGAGVLVQKDFFIKSGGFDEYYFYSGEEMDLGFRAWLQGYKVLYVPSAVMYHYLGRTGFRGKGVTPTVEFLITRNNLYFMLKNFELRTMISGMSLFAIRVCAKILFSLAHRNIHIFIAIARAHICIARDFKRILKARKETQAGRKVTETELRKRGILVGATEALRRTYEAAQNMKKRGWSPSFYDAKDSVKIVVDKKGEMSFQKL